MGLPPPSQTNVHEHSVNLGCHAHFVSWNMVAGVHTNYSIHDAFTGVNGSHLRAVKSMCLGTIAR